VSKYCVLCALAEQVVVSKYCVLCALAEEAVVSKYCVLCALAEQAIVSKYCVLCAGLRLLAIGRNQYIDTMNQCRSSKVYLSIMLH